MGRLDVGDHIKIARADPGAFYVITLADPAQYRYEPELTASQALTNQEISALRSSSNQIYHITGVALHTNVRLYLKFRGVSLFGFTSDEYIDQDDAPEGNPWPLNLWAYNMSLFANVTERLGSATTALIIFTGDKYEIEEVTDSTELSRLKREPIGQPPLNYLQVKG